MTTAYVANQPRLTYSEQTPNSGVLDLFVGWTSGSQEAAAEIVQRYESRLRGYIRAHLSQLVKSRVDVEDISQEVFEVVFRRANYVIANHADDDRFFAWLRRIAHHRIQKRIDRETASKRDVTRETRPSENMTTEQLIGNSSVSLMSDHVRRTTRCVSQRYSTHESFDSTFRSMPKRQQLEVALLFEGNSKSEIATKLGLTARMVRRDFEKVREAYASLLN